jgi:KaiC/GvpD/RAD55 family RecA-like ATPase
MQNDEIKKVKPFSFEPLGLYLDKPIPPPQWIWDGVLSPGCVSMISGKPKIGKSTFIRYLAKCIADGEPLLGANTDMSRVAYLALEDHYQLSQQSFKDLGVKNRDNFQLHIGPLDRTANEELLKALEDEIQSWGTKLIVIDTFIKAMAVADTNSYSEVNAAFDELFRIARKTNCHIMVVHHSRKGEGGGTEAALGSIGFLGSVDTILTLERADSRSTLRASGRFSGELEFNFTKGVNGDLRILDLQERKLMISEKIKKAIYERPMTSSEIQKATGQRREVVLECLFELEKNGEVSIEGSGKKGSPKQYFCSPLKNLKRERNLTEDSNGISSEVECER